MHELNAAIYTTLTGGTALTALLSGTAAVYCPAAPDDAVYPYIVFNVQSGLDLNRYPVRQKEYIIQVASYATASQAAAEAIDAQVDALLHLRPPTVTGWNDFFCAKESEIQLPEVLPSKQRVYSVRSLYRFKLGKE